MGRIRKITLEDWRKIFEESGSSNYFQSPNWLTLQSKIFGLKNLFYECETVDGKKYISFQEKDNKCYSSFIGYGGFLCMDDTTIKFSTLQDTLLTIKSEGEFFLERIKLYPLIKYTGDKSTYKVDHTAILNINSDLKVQRGVIDKKTRNLINRSQNYGVLVKPLSTKDINNFYKFYTETMKRVGSDYLTPIDLFKTFTTVPEIKFLGAYKDGKLIAASIFLTCNKVIYYWWNASSQKGRKLDANYALIYEAIKFGVNNNFRYLDMASSHSESIERPKLKWGAQKYPLYIFSNQSTT